MLGSFNCFLDLEELAEEIKKQQKLSRNSQSLAKLKAKLENTTRITPVIEQLLDQVGARLTGIDSRATYMNAKLSSDISEYKRFIYEIESQLGDNNELLIKLKSRYQQQLDKKNSLLAEL